MTADQIPLVVDVPSISVAQMREVDRAMVWDYGIALIQMMENAGRSLAQLARVRFLDGDATGRRVAVLAGTGGNGGGALAAARHLANAGAIVTVQLTRETGAFAGVSATQLGIVQGMGIAVLDAGVPVPPDAELILDGLIGYSLSGAPRGEAERLIRTANAHTAKRLSLDIPSGLDGDLGQASGEVMKANATMTLGLPKNGLLRSQAIPTVGELYLADISVPPALYAGPGLAISVPPIFAEGALVRVQQTSGPG